MILRGNIKENQYIEKSILEFSILVFVFSTATTLLNELSIMQCIFFALFQIGLILLPGIAVVLIFKISLKTELEFLAISYIIGYMINILLYFLTVPFALQSKMWIMAIVLLGASLFVIFKRRTQLILEKDTKGKIICGIIILGMLIVEQFTYNGANLLPPKAIENVYNNDLLYWVGNSISLMKQYPPNDFRNYGELYNYHYFSSIQIAVICLITGLKPVVASFCYSFFQPVILLVMGSYCLFRKCTSNKCLIVMGMMGILATSGIENLSVVTYTAHMYLGPFGFDISIAVLMFLFYFIIQQYETEKFDLKLNILILAIFTVLMGCKASTGVIAICGIGILCFGWLLQREYKKAFGYGISILFLFILLYFFVVNMKGYGGSVENVLNAPKIYDSSVALMQFRGEVIRNLSSIHIPKMIIEVLFTILYSILCNIFIFVLFWIAVILKVFYVRKGDCLDFSCIIATLCGIILTICIGMYGRSQMYFAMATYSIAMIFILRTFNCVYSKRKINEHLKTLGTLCMGGLLLLGMFFWYRGYDEEGLQANIPKYLTMGFNNYISNTSDVEYNSTYINSEMYDAFEYVRMNLDKNAILASNRESLSEGVFTERYIIENKATKELFENNNYDTINELKSMGINYLIQTKMRECGKAAEFELPIKYGKICFENTIMRIYELDNN